MATRAAPFSRRRPLRSIGCAVAVRAVAALFPATLHASSTKGWTGHTLGAAGIVESVRGVGGGYRFVANPRRLTLLDVILLFEGLGGEGSSGAPTNAVDRALGTVLAEIDEIARATFGSITVATMLKMIGKG
mgnify:CR=1 FL=1